MSHYAIKVLNLLKWGDDRNISVNENSSFKSNRVWFAYGVIGRGISGLIYQDATVVFFEWARLGMVLMFFLFLHTF